MVSSLDLDEILQDLRATHSTLDDPQTPLDGEAQTSYVAAALTEDQINKEIINKLLTPHQALPWDLLDEFQQVPEVGPKRVSDFYDSLMELSSSINRTTIRFKRQGIDGHIISYAESFDLAVLDEGESASSSLSMKRKFTSKNEALTGGSSFLPFQPGGLAAGNNIIDATKFLSKDERGLFDIPQGLTRGLEVHVKEGDDHDIIDIQTEQEDDEQSEEEEREEIDTETDLNKLNEQLRSSSLYDDDDIEEILPMDMIVRPTSFLTTATSVSGDVKTKKREWAHIVELTHDIENFDELVPNPARVWPFKLDIFQQEAVYHLEQGDSVFIAAHTSAGKTVVAEYAIAMAHRNMTKAIYTSPIKALSNQKFRDFKETFKEVGVGIITGDVQINAEANCLIMTTEILRSMLYRGADLIRDVEFVIFDEVHYVNDVDRGVVWEEVIIMLPDHIKVILLSATVPNTYEFASWVGRTKQKDIYVISTPKRPIPLEIFGWAKGELFKLIDSSRTFSEVNFRKHTEKLVKPAKDVVPARGGLGGARGGARGGGAMVRGGARGGRGGGFASRGSPSGGQRRQRDSPNKNTWPSLIHYLKDNDLMPAVIFVFSKKRCEEYADTLGGVNLCSNKESSEIHMFIDKAVSRLKREDRELPQIVKIREMLSRGIAVHHGGLLPIVKECIEILFSKMLVKVLFATETFAMGLNLPTRTVVFSELRKHDGTGFRDLLPGEFTQMSGRAGRRGLDKTGTVIVMSYNEPLEQRAFKDVTLGTPTKLSSQFRLTYNMILNLLRVEALRVEEMIKRSFSENSTQSLLPEHQLEVTRLESDLATDKYSMKVSEEDAIRLGLYYDCMEQLKKDYGRLVQESFKLPFYQKKLRSGRLIVFRDGNISRPAVTARWANGDDNITLLTFDSSPSGRDKNQMGSIFTTDFDPSYVKKFFPKWSYHGNPRFVNVPLTSIEFVTDYYVKAYINGILNNDGNSIIAFKNEMNTILSFQKKLNENDWKLMNLTMSDILSEMTQLKSEIEEYLANENFADVFDDNYKMLVERKQIEQKVQSLRSLMSDDNMELLPDYEQRLDVLQELEFINGSELTVNLKGRVACEINIGWELIVTELLFDNFLSDLTSEEIVALLSCFVYEGKRMKKVNNEGHEESSVILMSTPRLEKGKAKIMDIVERTLKVYTDKNIILTSDEESFLESNRFGLVNTVYEWARGQSFKEIMELSNDCDEAEGTIVRVITRLDQVCVEVKNCALIIGDSALHSKMDEAQEKIKRDIVFCASLYL
ncbi:hypothetical protein CANARDRAFT_6124 [[Candida] arabinofermentans NRRL YB-2248]|uniref:Antiviral helicase SKI2 n=1 Tax=[Candida] arabinofermentans NRRL YB-2248 TaxID=983967 RepID=A0A1E4T761_9ASCO|nr:hypothetical protein CANARDRAFT_6124 [[Candida] arabinofermentans NRRL YB-2248]